MITKQLLIDKYGPKALKRSALNIRNGAEIIADVMQKDKITTAIEIGTYRGFTSAIMSQYCKELYTFDLKHGRIEQVKDIHPEQAEIARSELWKDLGIHNIHLALIEDDIEKARILEHMKFDFAFVDGAHDETVKNDFELVKKCGRVLFHDYDDSGCKAKNHVYDFINTLPKDEVEVIDIFAYWRKP